MNVSAEDCEVVVPEIVISLEPVPSGLMINPVAAVKFLFPLLVPLPKTPELPEES